jgi:hypothetical protein
MFVIPNFQIKNSQFKSSTRKDPVKDDKKILAQREMMGQCAVFGLRSIHHGNDVLVPVKLLVFLLHKHTYTHTHTRQV